MGTRGRKSASELAVASPVERVARPAVPLDLHPEEATVWQVIVDAMPADWFPAETHPLLAQYCRHTVSARRVSQLIDAAMSRKEVDVDEVDKLLKMQAKETAALKAMAASMRLSQQSTTHDKTAHTMKRDRRTVSRPWES